MTLRTTRRGLLYGGLASLGAAALAGCGEVTGLDPSLEAIATPNPGAPTRGGVLVYGLSSDPSNFEPHVSTGSASDTVRQLAYNGLLQFDGRGRVVDDLALEHGWDSPTRFTVRLRPDVRFHDGSRLTVDDVVFSFRRILDKKTAATAKSLLGAVERVEASGDSVVFTLAAPNDAFPLALASPSANVVSRSWIESGVNVQTQMMGTGPFRFVERIPGVSLTFERFDDYFDDALPYLNAIQFVPMADDYARVTALRSASVDMIDYVPATHVGVIEKNPQLVMNSDRTFGFGWVGFVTNRAPFDDVRVRKAVSLAIDRESVLQTAFLGNGKAMTGGLLPGNIASYADSLAGTMKHDPEQARFLLRKAGREGLQMPMVTTSTYSVIARPAEAVLPGLDAAGIDVRLTRQEWLTFRETIAAKTFPTHSWGSALSYGDPDALRDFVGSDGVFAGYFNFGDDRIDRLLTQGRQTRDESVRSEIYRDVERRVLELVPMAATVRRQQGEAHYEYVKGYQHPPKGAWTQTALRRTWLEKA